MGNRSTRKIIDGKSSKFFSSKRSGDVDGPIIRLIPGLAGKFFNGSSWRSTISTGNIGTLPLTTTNDSSNVTGTTGLPSANHRYGVNLWTSIAYGDGLGDNYGFIAIGYFTPPTTGTYTIYTSSDDGSGVWIGTLALEGANRTSTNAVVNNGLGSGQGNTKRSGSISLTGGVTYPIRIVHEEGNGGDNLTFSWSGPSITETTSLSTYFTTPETISSGQLTGNYLSSAPSLVLNLDAGNSASYPGSGTTWTDLSEYLNNGTLTGGPTYSSSNGGYIDFDGTDDYVGTSGMFDCNSNFTFNSWVNADVNNTIRTIISKRSAAGSIQIRFNSSNQVQIIDNNVVEVGSFSSFTFSASTWYNICVVRSSNTYNLYVNGAYVSNFTSSNTYTYDADTIGQNYIASGGGSEKWDGKISAISAYNRALSASEIQQNFDALRGRFGI